MATYFGHKPRWKQDNFGRASGPLRPPTPVEPRPVQPYKNKPLGQKRLTLPGPGPKAGGRYGVTLPFQYDPRNSASEDMQRYFHQRKALEYSKKGLPSPFKTMKGILRRSNPWMRGLDLGFQLLDMWQTIQQEDPIKLSGSWQEHCRTGLQVFTDYRILPSLSQSTCNQVNGTCGQTGQITSGSWGPGSSITHPGYSGCSNIYNQSMHSIAFGPGTGSGASRRMTFARVIKWCQEIRCPGQGPSPTPIVWAPPVVVRVPRAEPPPAPREAWQPRRQRRDKPRPDARTRTRSRTGLDPRTNPRGQGYKPPYWPVKQDHPDLPLPGEEKRKIIDPRIAQWYGWLTEMKDALKCFEKSLGVRPKGGLHDRIIAVATRAVERGITVEQFADVQDCMRSNDARDFVIGKANRLANRITKNQYWRRPFGIGRGGFAVRM